MNAGASSSIASSPAPLLTPRRRIVRWSRPSSLVAAAMLSTIVVLCLASPLLFADPNALDLSRRLQPPSAEHLMGTDDVGRDVLSRVFHGGRIDLLIGISGALLSLLVGGVLGLVLGYFRGKGIDLFMRGFDVAQAFPLLIFALAMLAFLGAGTSTFIIAIAFVNVPIFLRLVRVETLSVREQPFVEAAESVGNSTPRILFRHVLPNVSTSALTQFTTSAGQAVIIVGALSFLGVGIQPPSPEWGSMIQDGARFLFIGQWWVSIFPGILIVLTVLSLNTLGEGFVSERRVR